MKRKGWLEESPDESELHRSRCNCGLSQASRAGVSRTTLSLVRSSRAHIHRILAFLYIYTIVMGSFSESLCLIPFFTHPPIPGRTFKGCLNNFQSFHYNYSLSISNPQGPLIVTNTLATSQYLCMQPLADHPCFTIQPFLRSPDIFLLTSSDGKLCVRPCVRARARARVCVWVCVCVH